MIVGVTGSRDWADAGAIRRGMAAAQDGTNPGDMLLIHGKCPPRTDQGKVLGWNSAKLLSDRQKLRLTGADWLASVIANQLHWPERAFPAQWDVLGAGAGYARNTTMVEYRAHLWLAFISACTSPGRSCAKAPHGSHGSADCLAKIKAAGLPYVLYRRGW